MVKKTKNAEPSKPKQKEKIKTVKHPLCQPNPKNFRFGNDVRPRIVKSRFVKFPRYVQLQRQKRILMKRLKCPPALAQFFDPLDKDTCKKVYKALENYTPETKHEKKERLEKEAKEQVKDQKNKKKDQKKDGKKPITVKCGLNHVTYLVEQKRAKLVLIAADVDPIETVVFLPSLCKTMDIPYAIVPSKERLGHLANKKTCTCLALTDFKDNAADLENLCKIFRERFQGPPAHSRKPEKGVKAIQKEKKQEKELLAKK
jgi:large subunit ribosomal protein L7Ae